MWYNTSTNLYHLYQQATPSKAPTPRDRVTADTAMILVNDRTKVSVVCISHAATQQVRTLFVRDPAFMSKYIDARGSTHPLIILNGDEPRVGLAVCTPSFAGIACSPPVIYECSPSFSGPARQLQPRPRATTTARATTARATMARRTIAPSNGTATQRRSSSSRSSSRGD